ncbi:glycoprotein hormone beta-5-like [Xyrauchen texanus]|uniref:glycoprotein hormone beta-5-like n=1 Tax=Xyrauchen texanus TaxID=154827 RepID=UPI002241FEAE|nr:glycoprotein hormone beta-5-like [Xyrauchen texanus]
MAHLRSGAQRFIYCLTLAVRLFFGVHNEAFVLNLKCFIRCAVREFTLLARKPGCSELHITTDACWGRCETWEKPVLYPPFIKSYQRVCTYNETRLVTLKLPNCSAHVDPYCTQWLFSVTVGLSHQYH